MSQTKRTICVFTDWYVPGYKAGGPVQSVYNLCLLLSRHYEVKVICSAYDLNSTEPYAGIACNEWAEISENHKVMYLKDEGLSVKNIRSLLKENRYNIIYINGLYSLKFSFLPALFAFLYNVNKTFVSVRGMLHRSALSVKPVKKQIFLAFVRGFGLYRKMTLIASNREEEQEIRRSLGKLNIRIAPNVPMMPEADFSAEELKLKRHGKLSILFLGRIAPEKNPLLLLNALMQIKEPVRLTVCGSGREAGYLSTFRDVLAKLPPNIETQYIEHVPHSEVKSLLKANDLMVLPSLGENFGHAIFESFVCHVPVIIGNNTPWKGIGELKAGIEVDPGNAEELRSAIEQFIHMDESTYLDWCKGAGAEAERYFKSNNFEELYLKLFS